MADRGNVTKAVEKSVRGSGKSKDEERNDIVGLVLSCLLTAAGAGLTGFFGDKVRKNIRANK